MKFPPPPRNHYNSLFNHLVQLLLSLLFHIFSYTSWWGTQPQRTTIGPLSTMMWHSRHNRRLVTQHTSTGTQATLIWRSSHNQWSVTQHSTHRHTGHSDMSRSSPNRLSVTQRNKHRLQRYPNVTLKPQLAISHTTLNEHRLTGHSEVMCKGTPDVQSTNVQSPAHRPLKCDTLLGGAHDTHRNHWQRYNTQTTL